MAKRWTDNTMAKRWTDNTMAKRKRTKGQTPSNKQTVYVIYSSTVN
jgi:hypothetical protein